MAPPATLSGTVRRHICTNANGKREPKVVGATDRPVSVSGGGKTKETETNDNGIWHVKVSAGISYTVRLPGTPGGSMPASRK